MGGEPLTPERIAEIRAMLDAATPGPYRAQGCLESWGKDCGPSPSIACYSCGNCPWHAYDSVIEGDGFCGVCTAERPPSGKIDASIIAELLEALDENH